MKDVFNIEKFNIFSDEENYYFFRALNLGDNSDIENEITTDIDGNITKIRVDRKRFSGTPKYSENSIISLEEIFDHIKMNNNKETNCISLTSNANAAIDYGRGSYKDRYVIVKVPKKEMGKKVYNAGLYMLEEINSKINELISSGDIDLNTLSYLNEIDNIADLNDLKSIIDRYKESTNDDMFKKGINYIKPESAEVIYQTPEYDIARNIFYPKEVDWISEFIEFINKGYTPGSNEAKKRKIDNSTIFNRWSHNNEEIIKRFDTDPKYQTQKYDVSRIYFENYKMTNEKKYVDSEENINTLNKK